MRKFVVQLLSCVQLFVTSWTIVGQASQSFTSSQHLLKLTSIESVMPSNHLILWHPLILPSVFPSIRVFSNESALPSGGQSIGASASALVLLMNIQGRFPLELTGLISLPFKGLSRVWVLAYTNLKSGKSHNAGASCFLDNNICMTWSDVS